MSEALGQLMSQDLHIHQQSHPLHQVLMKLTGDIDIDGTLCDSDPLYRTNYAFCEILQEIGFNGKHNEELWSAFLSDWELEKAMKFIVDQEALFRRILFLEKATDGARNGSCWYGY
ncbi:putative HAD-like superfamily protein [Helianthus annuus]|nr:putative HAD-like superfamily protein [Helianthus annuus]